MTRDSSFPATWVRLCRALGLPESASIDTVHAAAHRNGVAAVGRGTIQRIREAKSTRITSLMQLAEAAGVSVSALVDDKPEEPQRPAPQGSVGLRASVDAIVDALASMDEHQRARAARAFALIADDPSVDSMRQAFADFMDPAQEVAESNGASSRKRTGTVG